MADIDARVEEWLSTQADSEGLVGDERQHFIEAMRGSTPAQAARLHFALTELRDAIVDALGRALNRVSARAKRRPR